MIRFLFKGLWRDKSRSRLPIIVVATGVTLTIFLHAYIVGFMGDTIEMNARFNAGHVKVMTKAFEAASHQLPIDLALDNVSQLLTELQRDFPQMEWSSRIQFGGLADVPDENGETKAQGPFIGMAMNLSGDDSRDVERLQIASALTQGKLPANQTEVLMSDHFARALGLNPGDSFTMMTSSANASMRMQNFTVSGTLIFGAELLDRGSVLMDIGAAQQLLEMEDATAEILGFFKNGYFDSKAADLLVMQFNSKHDDPEDDFSPVMKSLRAQGSMGQYVEMAEKWSWYVSFMFILAMSLVLWNAGLLGGLRRYGEVGLRLAIGEEKKHIYFTLLLESVLIGLAGTFVGTLFGLLFAWMLQTWGIDISGMMQGASLMFPSVIKARITPTDFYLGFFPGILSTLIGTALSGIGIFKRQTASLFKELEV